jgi:hypothetical protein
MRRLECGAAQACAARPAAFFHVCDFFSSRVCARASSSLKLAAVESFRIARAEDDLMHFPPHTLHQLCVHHWRV